MFAAQKTVGNGLAAWAKNLDPSVLGATSALYAHQPLTQAQRADVGAHALATTLPDEATWLQTFLPQAGIASITQWPAQPLKMVAVNASDGAIRVFDARSGAPIQRAIAASAAVPSFTPPITIDGRRYIDGGVRSLTNADLARDMDLDLVIISSPMTQATARPVTAAMSVVRPPLRILLRMEIAALRRAGVPVVAIEPVPGVIRAMGHNPLDAKPRAAVSRVTYASVAAWLEEHREGRWVAAVLKAAAAEQARQARQARDGPAASASSA
jgi:NTE family protein